MRKALFSHKKVTAKNMESLLLSASQKNLSLLDRHQNLVILRSLMTEHCTLVWWKMWCAFGEILFTRYEYTHNWTEQAFLSDVTLVKI